LLLADCARNAKSEVCTPGGRDDVRLPTVSVRNCGDDRQAEAGSSRPSALLSPTEALERVLREAHREARTIVLHV
jgi:hypothetical protein